MVAQVHQLEEYRKDNHIVITCEEGNVHVVPEELIKNLISGKVELFMEENKPLLRAIIKEWHSQL